LVKSNVKQNVRVCTVAVLAKKAYKSVKEKVFDCSYKAIQFDTLNKRKDLFYADVRIFDEQEWHYPAGSPIIIPGLFIKSYRVRVSSSKCLAT
jgi:hypothetical protein